MGVNSPYDAAIGRAVRALEVDLAGGLGRSLEAVMAAVRLRGGVEVIDGKEFVRKPILDEVTAEVIERYMADLRARITPRVEKLSPEAAEAVDIELAQALVDIKAIFGISEAIFGIGDDSPSPSPRGRPCARRARPRGGWCGTPGTPMGGFPTRRPSGLHPRTST